MIELDEFTVKLSDELIDLMAELYLQEPNRTITFETFVKNYLMGMIL